MFEKELLTSFMGLQVHLLIHLVDGVELVGVVSCRWMLFLERYMKKSKVLFDKGPNLRGLWQRGKYRMSLSIMSVSTSSTLTIDQVQGFGTMKGMKTKEKGSCSKRMEKSA